MKEKWKPIPNYEGFYEASSKGRIRCVPRKVRRVSKTGNVFYVQWNSRILRPGQSTNGLYLIVGLSRKGKIKSWNVHVLVARAFHGPCPKGKEVRHLDGDGHNNRPGNLCYGTKLENMADKIGHGKTLRGERGSNAILNDKDVKWIRKHYKARDKKYSATALGKRFGVSLGTIWSVANHKHWNYL